MPTTHIAKNWLPPPQAWPNALRALSTSCSPAERFIAVGARPVDAGSRGEALMCGQSGMFRDAFGFRGDMTALSFDPYALLAECRLGILATIKADGRPQLSPVMPFYDRRSGVIYVSMRAGLAKTVNLRRDPRATLEVTRPDGRAWATAEGSATLTGPGTDVSGPEVEALVVYYRLAAGEHPDWDEYRSAMVSDRRVLMAMTVDKVYGADIG